MTAKTKTPWSRGALLDRDYKQCDVAGLHRHANSFYQRLVRAPNGVRRYFINVYEYRLDAGHTGWQAELSTRLKDGKYIDVTLHPCESVEEAEDFFELLFVRMDGLDYDSED